MWISILNSGDDLHCQEVQLIYECSLYTSLDRKRLAMHIGTLNGLTLDSAIANIITGCTLMQTLLGWWQKYQAFSALNQRSDCLANSPNLPITLFFFFQQPSKAYILLIKNQKSGMQTHKYLLSSLCFIKTITSLVTCKL